MCGISEISNTAQENLRKIKKREEKRMCKRITDKREKKKYAVFALFAFLFAASVFFFSGKTEVRAGPLDNAIDYYNTYGEKDVSPQIISG